MVHSRLTPKAVRSDPWVFREGRISIPGNNLRRDLEESVRALESEPLSREKVLSALLRAGELETALADIGWTHLLAAIRMTDALAAMMWPSSKAAHQLHASARDLFRLPFPELLRVSPAEGFAYYALHPVDFVNLAYSVAEESTNAAIIGIRSIGTTLSALVMAALTARGRRCERISLRPGGHPYDRTTRFTPAQLRWIARQRAGCATFLVVDEGPGRSGSSFLSVGEALVGAGVSTNQIIFLGSRQVDPQQLCAADAVLRWSRFRFFSPEKAFCQRFEGYRCLGMGYWRPLFLPDQASWPPAWPHMERLKFLSPDQRRLFKFEGFGHYGQQILDRAKQLESAGFSCSAEDAGDGFLCYPILPGAPARRSELTADLLERMAHYCAFRAKEFPVAPRDPSQLPDMLRFNLSQEFDEELAHSVNADLLAASTPVVTDGRMQPHEWVRGFDGKIVKIDAYSHGDDHFFPGPTDIAWDLAGAMVEWQMRQDAEDSLIARFHRLTGDNPSHRLPLFRLAYSVFRLAYCRMALSAVGEAVEKFLLRAACGQYRNRALVELARALPQEKTVVTRRREVTPYVRK
jgi:hypothetical protein